MKSLFFALMKEFENKGVRFIEYSDEEILVIFDTDEVSAEIITAFELSSDDFVAVKYCPLNEETALRYQFWDDELTIWVQTNW